MALSANSYGTVAELEVMVRHLLDGASAFDGSTVPTLTEVETIIDRVSGVLNTALSNVGFSVPVSDATAVLACDDFVIKWSMRELRNAYPHLGISDQKETKDGSLWQSAHKFVSLNKKAFQNLGESVGDPSSDGLSFTALDTRDNRSDPVNTSREQPKFWRGQFDS
ncbi:MAG: hypothetical protein M9918_24630 [Anaerolineae bacterium]|nr:hypothetical protein [Anaerolineae bacterium]